MDTLELDTKTLKVGQRIRFKKTRDQRIGPGLEAGEMDEPVWLDGEIGSITPIEHEDGTSFVVSGPLDRGGEFLYSPDRDPESHIEIVEDPTE